MSRWPSWLGTTQEWAATSLEVTSRDDDRYAIIVTGAAPAIGVNGDNRLVSTRPADLGLVDPVPLAGSTWLTLRER